MRLSRILRFAGPALATASLAWCVFIGWYIWTTPWVVHGIRGSMDSAGGMVRAPYESSKRFSDVSLNGPLPLIIPVLIAAVACTGSWARIVALTSIGGFLLLAFAILGGFTIGGAYLPAVAGVIGAVVCEVAYRQLRRHPRMRA